MEKSLNIGDEVTLMSGGERMVVSKVNGDDATCVWTDKSGKLQEAVFNAQMLKLAPKGVQVAKLTRV